MHEALKMPNLRLKQIVWRLSLSIILVPFTVWLALGQTVPKVRLETMPRQYTGPRLLRDLARDLTAKFGWRISLEEPPWVMSQGAGPMFRKEIRLSSLDPHSSILSLPDGKLNLKDVFAADYSSAQELIQACLDEYSKQGNQGGYVVRATTDMLHIIPNPESQAVQIAGKSLLEYEISVAVEERLPRDHFAELCKAIQQASGVACVDGGTDMRFNETYLASEPERVKWGCTNTKARVALEDYLSHSLTTLTWQLMCHPKEAGDRVCFLSLIPLELEVQTSKGRVRRPVYHDRGWRFPFPPPPPPPDEK